MSSLFLRGPWLAVLAICLFAGSPARAQTVVTKHVTWNLDALAGSPAGPFSLNFQLIDGAGTGNGNLTVEVLNAPFSGVTLSNASFFESENRAVTPVLGSPLEFDVRFSDTGFDDPTPDQLSFALLDSTGFELPTHGPADASATVDLTAAGLSIGTYAGDTGRTPNAGGPALALAAPVFSEVEAVPEPGSLLLLLPSLGAILVLRRKKGV